MYGGSAIGVREQTTQAGRPRVDPDINSADELGQARTHGWVASVHILVIVHRGVPKHVPLGAFVACDLCWKIKQVPRGYGEAPPRLSIVVCC